MLHEEILTKEVSEWNNHLSVIELLDILKTEMLKKLNNRIKVFTQYEIDKINYIIEECSNWTEITNSNVV